MLFILDIPISAQVVSVADVYDALTSERPYKKAYTPNIAHNIMAHVNKGQFDPDLLRLFFNNVSIYPVGTVLKTIYGYSIVSQCIFGKTETPTMVLLSQGGLGGGRQVQSRRPVIEEEQTPPWPTD